jgi:Asp-tRNA(Asn)/Glu-tRNA(Gln) amidotransferase A subunit family amidase
MSFKIALVTDRSGRYAHVWGVPKSWNRFIDQLEDAGCEVIEDQTDDWEGCTPEEVAEDCLTIHQLLNDTDFIPH